MAYIIIPIIICLSIFYCSNDTYYIQNYSSLQNNIITLIGILIGFTISVFTILLTVDNKSVKQSKETFIDKSLYSKKISLYETILVGLGYLIIIQGFLLIINFIYPLFIDVKSNNSKLIFSINIAIVVHVILLLMRCVLDFYFIITKKE